MGKILRRGYVLVTILLLLTVVVVTVPLNVSAYTGNVFILADGSVVPSTAPVTRDADTYTLTNDITGTIYIQRTGITLDGAGHTLDATGLSWGIYQYGGYGVHDVTIKNLKIESGSYGMVLFKTNGNTITGCTISGAVYNNLLLDTSSGNTITDNSVSGGYYNIYMYSSNGNIISTNMVYGSLNDGLNMYNCDYNTITANSFSANMWSGIYISYYCEGNLINLNTLSNNKIGLYMHRGTSNTIWGNTMTLNDYYGMMLYEANSNTIYYNNFQYNSWNLVNLYSANTFDNGAGEGNYWDSYTGIDIDGDGIGDTLLPHMDVDYYPLMELWVAGYDIDDIIEAIDGMETPDGIKNSLISKLENALKSLSKDNDNAAMNQLNAFMNEVEAQTGKMIAEEDAADLIEMAQWIIEDMTGE